MSLLNTVTTGPTQTGLRIVIGGQEKMGKTTLAAGAPDPLLLPLEVGYAGITIPKTAMVQQWDLFMQGLNEICQQVANRQFQHRSLIIDSATAAERHLHQNVIERDPAYRKGAKKTLSMESAHGGYGKAYGLANDDFSAMFNILDWLAAQGINIIMTAHVFSSKVMDPTAGEYDSWDLLLHSPKNNKTYGKRELITQWADIVGFLYEPVFITEAGRMQKAVSQNKGRVLGLARTPAYVAGNRFGMNIELAIPPPPANGWNALADAIQYFTGIDVHSRQ